jgi:hypothetical protein
MKYKFFILGMIIMPSISILFAQNVVVQVLAKDTSYEHKEYPHSRFGMFVTRGNNNNKISAFYLIPSSTSPIQIKYVATIKATAEETWQYTVNDLINRISDSAHELGANSYKLADFYYNDTTSKMCLTLDVYFCNSDLVGIGAPERTTTDVNDIYIFPIELNGKHGNSMWIKTWKPGRNILVNHKSIYLRSREYLVYHVQPNERVIIGRWNDGSDIQRNGYENIISQYMTYGDRGLIPLDCCSTSPLRDISEDWARFLMNTYYIYPKTCENCSLKGN